MHDHPDTIIDELDHEWQRHLATGSLDDALTGWRHEDDRLAAFSSICELVSFLEDSRTPCSSQDDVLLALLTIGRRDPLASRLVLHRFVPALKRMAAWDQPFTILEWACHVVAEAFEVVATYPVEQRPARVAANVVMDVRKRLYALLAEHQTSQAELGRQQFVGVAAVPGPAEVIDAAQLIDWGRREAGLHPDVAALILATRVLGFTVKELAHCLGVPSAGFASGSRAASSASARPYPRSENRLSHDPPVSGLHR